MIIDIPNATVSNVWREEGTDKETGRTFEFCRASLNVPGEAPMQVSVKNDDFEAMSGLIGESGEVHLNLDAQPNRRVRLTLVGIE